MTSPTTEGRDVAAIAKAMAPGQRAIVLALRMHVRRAISFSGSQAHRLMLNPKFPGLIVRVKQGGLAFYGLTPLGILVRQHLNDIQGANNE
jgi:hypothetical protein